MCSSQHLRCQKTGLMAPTLLARADLVPMLMRVQLLGDFLHAKIIFRLTQTVLVLWCLILSTTPTVGRPLSTPSIAISLGTSTPTIMATSLSASLIGIVASEFADCDAKKQWTCEQAIKKHLGDSASFGSYSGNLLNLPVPASMLASGDAGRSYDYTKARGVFVYLEKLSCVESIYTNDARVLAGVRDSNKTRLLSAEAGLSLSVKIVEGCGESLATEPKKGWW